MSASQKIEVFHDGGCPVCQLEIRFYGKLDRAGHILWTDILVLADADLPPGKTRNDLLGKFHVRELPARKASKWHTGVDAFARIWQELPYFNWFAWIFRVPLVRQAAQLAYLGFLRWQAAHRRKRRDNPHCEERASFSEFR